MAKISAGLLLYRVIKKELQVFLAHPGGPFWKNKDAGAWSIIKGEVNDNEDLQEAALREFYEETGWEIKGNLIALQPVKLKSGKVVHAWALNMDMENKEIKSNRFTMEWPPHSGKMQSFPEIDRAEWFTIKEAKKMVNEAQVALLDELEHIYEKEVRSYRK